jgi:hypothetical protein
MHRHRKPRDRHVYFGAGEPRRGIPPGDLPEGQLPAWQRLRHAFGNRGDEPAADPGLESDPQGRVLRADGFGHRVLGLVPLSKEEPDLGQHDLARPGQPYRAAVTLEEPARYRGPRRRERPSGRGGHGASGRAPAGAATRPPGIRHRSIGWRGTLRGTAGGPRGRGSRGSCRRSRPGREAARAWPPGRRPPSTSRQSVTGAAAGAWNPLRGDDTVRRRPHLPHRVAGQGVARSPDRVARSVGTGTGSRGGAALPADTRQGRARCRSRQP